MHRKTENGIGVAGLVAASLTFVDAASRSDERRHPDAAEAKERDGSVDLESTMDDKLLRATLEDNAAARKIADLLPMTLALRDVNGTEKIAELPQRLSTDGTPVGFTPSAGDFAFYAP